MANESQLDVLIRFLVDQAAQGNAVRGIEVLEKQLKDFEEQIKEVKKQAAELNKISATIGNTSRGMLVGGTAIVGGIFALAGKYVKDAKEATVVTEAWKRSQDELGKSGNRAGAILAQEALPLLQKAAQLADKAAGFVEAHPEIVRAALNTGLVLAGLGAVGVAVSKGIRFYADALYLAAIIKEQQGIRQFDAAVNKFLIGTGQMASSKYGVPGGMIGPAATAGGVAATGGALSLGQIGLAAAAFVGISLVINKELSIIEEGLATKLGTKSAGGIIGVFRNFISQIPGMHLIGPLDTLTKAIAKLKGQLSGIDDGSGKTAPTGARASEQFEQILSAYEKYKADDLKLVQDHYADRDKIISDSLKAETESNRQFSAAISRVSADASRAASKARTDFDNANAKAEADYSQQRANIIRDSAKEIEGIQKQSQERLRKLTLDHNDRVGDLTRSRDALGLAKENRDFARAKAEERSSTNQEIRQRRQDIALRLADLQQSYESEKAQRLIDYEQRRKEISADAAARMSELRAQHSEELRQIRQARVDKIKELNQAFIDEKKRRYQFLIANIRDLDASLLGEKELKKKYQDLMIADLDRFLAKYKSGLASLSDSKAVSKAGGGYAAFGTYRLGDIAGGGRGRPEYVLSGSTTEIAERALGGQLSQERLLNALMFAGGGSSQQVAYNDNRRMDSRIGPIDRQRLLDDSMQAMTEAFRMASNRR